MFLCCTGVWGQKPCSTVNHPLSITHFLQVGSDSLEVIIIVTYPVLIIMFKKVITLLYNDNPNNYGCLVN